MKSKGKKTWRKTRTPLLWEHTPTGKFYARVKVSGKDVWKCLDTDILSVAKNRIDEEVRKIRGAKNRSGAPTVRQALTDAAADKVDNPEVKDSTGRYYEEVVGTILETFSDPDMRLDKVRPTDMELWMRKHSKSYAPSRTNGALVVWRFMFKRAMDNGHVASDPSHTLKRRKIQQMQYNIPTRDDFNRIVASIEAQRKANSMAASFAVRFMAYTGLRRGDTKAIRWRDIKDNAIVLRLEKNDELRRIPLICAAKELLEEIKKVQNHGPDDPVVRCIPHEALKNACKRLDLPHLRIHDLRHIFATRCLESGVDLPTVSRWLGHKDGGALAAKTYGHLTDDHSATQAGKVKA